MSSAMRKPNILIVVIDSLRADHMSCYGYHRETTPNIDRLAAEGCLFETAITAAPFSPASYASIFSNLYPHQHGVNGDTVRVWPNSWPRLPEKMQECGYYTFCISNNVFVSRSTNADRGFDTFLDMSEPTWRLRQIERILRRVRMHFGDRVAHSVSPNRVQCAYKGDSHKTVRNVISLIKENARPFFGFVILMDPHTPYNRLRRQYCDRPANVRRFFRMRNSRAMWSEMMASRTGLNDAELGVVCDIYDSEIQHADACVGQLQSWLRMTHILDDTILVVTADHGEAFGEHGVWGHGFCLNDCLTRVPLILRHPKYWSPGTRSAALVQLHDLHQLCTSVSETGDPDLHQYPKCLTQASNAAWRGRDFVYSEFARQSKTLQFMQGYNQTFNPGLWDHDMWAIRSRDWRCIEYGESAQEFYDLGNDPLETTPCVDPAMTVANTLRYHLGLHKSELTDLQQREGGSMKDDVDDMVNERLKALGYIE